MNDALERTEKMFSKIDTIISVREIVPLSLEKPFRPGQRIWAKAQLVGADGTVFSTSGQEVIMGMPGDEIVITHKLTIT